MNTLTKIVASPEEIVLADKTEKLYPLRFVEWGQLEQWMRSKIVAAATDALSGRSEKEMLIIMQAAHKTASSVSVIHCLKVNAEGEGVSHLRSFEGMLRVLQLALRTSSAIDALPKYTLAEIDSKLQGDITKLSESFLHILDLSFPDVIESDTEKNG